MSFSVIPNLFLRHSSNCLFDIYELLAVSPFRKYKSSYKFPFIFLFSLLDLELGLEISIKAFLICSKDIFNKESLLTNCLKAFCSL